MSTLKQIILEMGVGVDLYGMEYTKAAKRAVQDAIHHSSLTFFRSLDLDPNNMEIELTLAAHEPDRIDLDDVAKELPYGKVTPRSTKGGLNVYDEVTDRTTIIVNAGIVVRYPLPA